MSSLCLFWLRVGIHLSELLGWPFLTVSSTPPYILLLPLGAALSLHNAPLLSSILCMVVLSLLLSSSLYSLGTPISCAFLPHIWNIMVFPPWSPVSSPHCITQLFNTSNLLPTTIFFFCSSSLLHFWARCLNLSHFLQILLSLPSNSALNLVKVHLLLSMSLMSLLYWSRNMVLCSGWMWFVCKKKIIFLEGVLFSSKGLQYVC